MQIFPTLIPHETPPLVKADGGGSRISQASPFASLLQSISDKADAQSSRAALGNTRERMEHRRQAELNKNGQHGLGLGAKVSLTDFNALRGKLKAQGLSDEDLTALQEKIGSSEGLSWKSMLQTVAYKLGFSLGSLYPELDSAARNELSAFFTKLGFSLEEGEGLIQDLENGKQSKVWQIVSKTVGKLGDEDLQQIGKSELAALAQALGLTGNALQRVQSMLQGEGSDTLPAKGTRLVLDSIVTESAKAQRQLDNSLGELRAAIESGLAKSRAALDLKSLADNRETRDVALAKVRIKDEAGKKFRSEETGTESDHAAVVDKDAKPGLKGDAKSSSKDAQGGEQAANQAARKEAPDRTDKTGKEQQATETKGTQTTEGERGGGNQSERRLHKDDLGHDGKQNQGDAKDGSGKDGDKKAFDEMWSKVTVRANPEAGLQQADRLAAQQAVFTAEPIQTAPLAGERIPPQRIVRTVQEGVLQNLEQGTKQLTLRLDPPNLGKLTVVLQVHGNEVRAMIRTENEDVTRMLNDQTNLLRHTLEQQGLKVEKLDVQTQANSEHNQRDWQGPEQHNAAQERNRDPLRSTLRFLRERNGEDEPLAHDMQNNGSEETNSHQGLHVIA